MLLIINLYLSHKTLTTFCFQYIGKIGTVHRVTDKGDIRVQFEGCNNRWTFNPVALCKVNSFSIGDIVSVISDLERVKDLQKGHGEWIDIMKNVCISITTNYSSRIKLFT